MLHEKLVGVIKTTCEQRKTGCMVLKRKRAGGRTGYPHIALSISVNEYRATRAFATEGIWQWLFFFFFFFLWFKILFFFIYKGKYLEIGTKK